jgi:hypothetical protein
MLSRRAFIGNGLGALAAGLLAQRALARRAFGFACPDTGALPYGPATPVLDLGQLPDAVQVAGMPFAPGWTGDDFPSFLQIPFHMQETNYPNGIPPDATETVDVCVVGGGMSGLCTAYLLREHHPVVLELSTRFGGVARGESWRGTPFSLGGAYFMTPDPGSFLDNLYHELGVDRLHKLSKDPDPVALNGQLINDIFHTPRVSEEERRALAAYKAMVDSFANNYPDIPLVAGRDNAWILELDRVSFKDDVERRLGYPAPPLLTSLIQAYFFSSFAAGWENVSAACGWNFVAAEEFGRWVLPGGNSGLTTAFYDKLRELETVSPNCPGQLLRAGCRTVEIRIQPDGLAKVIYKDAQGNFRALLARRVAVCCSKHIAKHIMIDPLYTDPARSHAVQQVETRGYVVANVLLNSPAPRTFYDVFMYDDGHLPADEGGFPNYSRITDFVDGGYAVHGSHSHTVLTCYWALAWPYGRPTLVPDDAWTRYATGAAGRVREILGLIGLPESAVAQVRLTRWGHAFSVSRVGLIANGVPQVLREPIANTVFFVSQDNWCLPAVETCLLEAADMAPKMARGL